MLRKLSLALVLTGLPMALFADAEAAKALNGLLAKANTVTAKFQQKTQNDAESRSRESNGTLSVQRPNLFRWEVTGPFPQLVISNGKKVWVYDPDLEQVTIQKLDKQLSSTPALLLSGDVKKLKENFDISQASKSGDTPSFLLKPKAEDSAFESLQISFKGEQITGMMLKDTLGSVTDIAFSNVKNNVEIEPGQFKLDIPEGVDVIER
ncbi:outer membrane lipoprotein chaperone LolA [Zooshikella harenae]|uniref:Outer-membrane lipoprotein carrier protein n=1 Tax=Zooshikella harenae TaxID=2827238 RepID=A0ABS5ZE47_9GAMM|nr:outer membrane lipoprotein chaperone LolA [Zooshikella harenae]MBU2712240.1 outer membrane lipoprotein chaperone LolA [Zooshikella harenae]